MKRWCAEAPSNIALVKYMGKDDPRENLPANPSLSLTLNTLSTVVDVREASVESGESGIQWISESVSNFPAHIVPELSEKSRSRFLAHASRVVDRAPALLAQFGIASSTRKNLIIRSASRFPQGAGLASSASSFAALTLAVIAAQAQETEAFQALYTRDPEFRARLSTLSRQGSGSSARSFDGPFVLWDPRDPVRETSRLDVAPIFEKSSVLVLVTDAREKKISSSDVHALVTQSPLWSGRVERAKARIDRVVRALRIGDRETVAVETWAEAWEMHSLFHTLPEPFTYWMPETLEILTFLRSYVRSTPAHPNPPWITMDAGPNIHLICAPEDASDWRDRIQTRFPGLLILSDASGSGARLAHGGLA